MRTGEDLLVLTIQIYDELGHQREAVSHWGCSVNIECNISTQRTSGSEDW